VSFDSPKLSCLPAGRLFLFGYKKKRRIIFLD